VCYRYYTDPSGTFWQCNAKAIGSGSEGADSSLQEQYNKVQYKINAKLINQYLYNSKETCYLLTNPSYIKAQTSQYELDLYISCSAA
jgi:20S proteasome alpha/beta subunit